MNTAPVPSHKARPYGLYAVIGCILLVGAWLTLLRFTGGIGSVSNLSDKYPWGFWTALDLLCGIALASGGAAVAAGYYIFGRNEFHVYVRAALTTAFLGYFFEVIALVYEVGQPWRLVYPFFLSQGFASILFWVGLCVATYLLVMSTELLPVLLEKMGAPKARQALDRLTPLAGPLAVVGATIAVMHQSALGALYLVAPYKIHPLWYSDWLPLLFLLSAGFAGLSMVIVEGSLAHRFLHRHMDARHLREADRATFLCARIIPLIMWLYLALRVGEIVVLGKAAHLTSGYGLLFLLELAGGVLLPALLYRMGCKNSNVPMVRMAATLTILGVVLNRFSLSLIAFNYQLPAAARYVPSWKEVGISLFLITLLVMAYGFMCSRFAILKDEEKKG